MVFLKYVTPHRKNLSRIIRVYNKVTMLNYLYFLSSDIYFVFQLSYKETDLLTIFNNKKSAKILKRNNKTNLFNPFNFCRKVVKGTVLICFSFRSRRNRELKKEPSSLGHLLSI
jgi:hypothetical protein